MKKQLLPLSILLCAALFTACGPSPESAAQEVCDCYGNMKNSQSLGDVAGSLTACSQMQGEYAQDFKGEDLKTFVSKTIECTTGGLVK